MPTYSVAKKTEVAERRAEIVRLKARGVPYSEIARRLGVSVDTARQDVHRAYQLRMQEVRESVDEDIARHLEEIAAQRELLWSIARTPHRRVGTSGIAAKDEDGNPIYEFDVNIRAHMALMKLGERESKLLGLDAAMKVDIKAQVVTVDAITAAISELERQIEAERG